MTTPHDGQPPTAERVLRVPQTATTPALLLRPWTERDIPAMVAAHRDPVLRRWLRNPVATAEQARAVIDAQRRARETQTAFSFAVLVVDTAAAADDPVGSVSIRGLGGAAASAELGYWVASPARGRGIAPRAVAAVCDWALRLPRPRSLDRLTLIHAIGNHASCRVADKAGFPLAALLPSLPPEFPGDAHLHVRTVRGNG
jgi:RimJ/RimL family protein N-acetyltransferase